jgi:cell division septation protein DedD
MANSSKNLWIVLALVAAGVVIFSMSLGHKEPSKPVVMQEVFSQTPQAAETNPEAKKDPVLSPAIVTSPTNGKEAEFAVQVYSFQDKDRADKALENLKAAGYNAFMEVSDLGEKGTWYRVRIGGLADENQAKAMLEDVRKNYKSGFIVKPKK